MFEISHHSARRWKEWIPLSTQQLRLRSLVQVMAFNLFVDKKELDAKTDTTKGFKYKNCYYFTLHSTSMSAPFYTSERIENNNPKWEEIEIFPADNGYRGSNNAVVIRLWCSHTLGGDEVISVWGINFNGMIYMGSKLEVGASHFKANAIVLQMLGGYFTAPDCLPQPSLIRFSSISISPLNVHNSYSVALLSRLHTLEHAIYKQSIACANLKEKISAGGFVSSERRSELRLNRLLQSKPRVQRQDLIEAKKKIEFAKYRVLLLRAEKQRCFKHLEDQKKYLDNISENNQQMESQIMEKYRLLRKEIDLFVKWKQALVSLRENQQRTRLRLNYRSQELISELSHIYPMDSKEDKYSICGIHLPNSEEFFGHDEMSLAVALGYVTHIVHMISIFIQVPLRYPVIHLGSQSRIVDQITDQIPDKDRQFPLFSRGQDKIQFHYAVYLLNKNIAQLRWLWGLPTLDLRNTLCNLKEILKIRVASSDYNKSPTTSEMFGNTLLITSPSIFFQEQIQKAITFPKYYGHRISKSIGSSNDLMMNDEFDTQSLSVVSTIGNSLSYSLDKGLNEFHEISATEKTETEKKSNSLVHLGAEALLNSNKRIEFQAEEVAKDKFLEKWDAEKGNMSTFSDDDYECHSMSQALVDEPAKDPKDTEYPIHTFNDSASTNIQTQLRIFPTEDVDKMSGLSASLTNINSNTQQMVNVPSFVIQKPEETLKKVDNSDISYLKKDDLLDSVASRAEALASQPTTFNRFRSRFGSTVENR